MNTINNNKSQTIYDIDTFLGFMKINNVMMPELKQYVYTTEDIPTVLSDDCISVLKDITSLLCSGTNPNDINFRNIVKMNINKLNQSNYDDILEKIKSMSYSSENNIYILVIELISGSIISPVAYKGYSMQEYNISNHQKTLPELCADIFREFCSDIFEIGGGSTLNFHSISLKILKGYFDNYMLHENKMDENNIYNSDNYKGFMSFVGLLFVRNIVSENIVLYCLKKIISVIFDLDSLKNNVTIRNNTECTNLYNGYKHLLDFTIYKLKNDTCTTNFLKELISNHQKFIKLNSSFKSFDSKNTLVIPLRPMSLINIKILGEQLNLLVDKNDNTLVKYIHQ